MSEKPIRIVIAEDNPITMMSLSLFFKDEKIEVTRELSYAEDILNAIRETQPDIVVTDIVLKGEKDGITAAKEVREKYAIPILFLSALSDKTTIERIEEIENSNWIVKPYVYSDLKDAIVNMVSKDD